MPDRPQKNSNWMNSNLLTVPQVAKWAKVSPKTIYRWIQDKQIRALRLGNRTYRIPEEDIVNLLKSQGLEYLLNESRTQSKSKEKENSHESL
ncbi:MAG: helix-turn-helix domain-containing protein [Anaerolineales bacterium]